MVINVNSKSYSVLMFIDLRDKHTRKSETKEKMSDKHYCKLGSIELLMFMVVKVNHTRRLATQEKMSEKHECKLGSIECINVYGSECKAHEQKTSDGH